jgi:hypothetical protein
MKKLKFIAVMLILSFGAAAQEYKPVAGDVTAEVGLTGGLLNSSLSLAPSAFTTKAGNPVPTLRFRYFLQDKLAIRVGANFTSSTTTTNFYEAAPGTGSGYDKLANSLFGMNLGIEKHFAGSDRLSTYAGADLLFQTTGASEKMSNSANGTSYTAGASGTVSGNNANGNNSLGIGVRVITGADYYFVEKVYIGGEFGFGFISSTNGEVKTSTTTPAGVTTNVTSKSTGGAFNIAPSMTAGVRIGYRF